MSIDVELNKWECMTAAMIGVMRQAESLAKKSKNSLKNEPNGWQVHCEGACGERAVAKVLDRYWHSGINTFKKGGDIGEVIEVRTRSKHEYDLVIRPNDKDDSFYVLCTGTAPHYVVHGFLTGREGKQDKWKANPHGWGEAFFVPKTALQPIEKLADAINTMSQQGATQ